MAPVGCAMAAVLCVVSAYAAAPPELPGEEITEQFFRSAPAPDTSLVAAPVADTSRSWLEIAARSWEAPTVEEQIGKAVKLVPLGQGTVFVPRMVEGSDEPEMEVYDSVGEFAAKGKPGEGINLLPGTYSVVLGSGAHKQQIVRGVNVVEGRVAPVAPTWSGLVIDVVDENSQPLVADYELVRIDEFEPYGRGRGADLDLGETPPAWILKPGLYKILGAGESYNSLRNFITVRLLPGQFVRVLLNMDEDSRRVIGGGVVQMGEGRSDRKKLWTTGIDLGGSILFNATVDRRERDDDLRGSNSSTIALLLNWWLRYDRSPFEWTNSLRLDEGLTVPDFEFEQIENSIDEIRLRSLFVWRLLRWLGPYGRFETRSNVFPDWARLSETSKYFYIVNDAGTAGTVDSSSTFQTQATFSPLTIETGLGANADIVNIRMVDARFRIGFGYSFTSVRDKYTRATAPASLASGPDSSIIRQSDVLQSEGSAAEHAAGPEAALTVDLRLGNFVTLRTELRVFAPVAPELRFANADYDWETRLSWRLARAITFDYELKYLLAQPSNDDLKVDEFNHRVQIRYSLRSR